MGWTQGDAFQLLDTPATALLHETQHMTMLVGDANWRDDLPDPADPSADCYSIDWYE